MVRIPTHGPPIHPGEVILEEFLRPLEMTQTEFSQRIGVAWTRANQIINGKPGVTPDTALRLAKLVGMPTDFWLTLQFRWDLYHTMHSLAAKAIENIERVPGLGRVRKSV